ncbi:patatin-like phospholipase family protein [Variovorax sp. dw_308]|uniref:patatin-like phospholipase family protein n=1 Tax=Variovorax sp. dw_308 TaxID=2721546 RepID=UPI001C47B634|nr:patatin-like phospholipase family protein [Variovorax sp. dw_308]
MTTEAESAPTKARVAAAAAPRETADAARADREGRALRMAEALDIERRVLDREHPVHATVAFEQMRNALPTGDDAPPRARGTVGLALSGGGIRSATFGLGVLQALAARGKLGAFDYLSTVSGGGYIGSWLSAWIHRAGLAEVQAQLGEFGSVNSKGSPTSAEPGEVSWLRRYSNYLAPRTGLLSYDTLTLITTWLRNVTLNAVVLVGFLCAVLALPFLLLALMRFGEANYVNFGFAAAWWGIVFFSMIGYNLWQQSMRSKRKRNWVISTPGVVSTVVLPGVMTCCCAAIWLGDPAQQTMPINLNAGAIVASLLALMFLGWALAEILLKPKTVQLSRSEFWVMSGAGVVGFAAGALALAGLYLGWRALLANNTVNQAEILLLLLGPPSLVFAFAVATTVFTGMVGRAYFERSREWWSRLNAWLLSFGTAWAIWIGLAFFSLPLLVWMHSQIGNWVALLGTGWIGSLLASVLFKKPETKSKQFALKVDSILNIAAGIFIVGLLVVLSALVAQGFLLLSDQQPDVSRLPFEAAKAAYEVTDAGQQLAYTVVAKPEPSHSLAVTTQAYLAAFYDIRRTPLRLPFMVDGVDVELTVPAATLLCLVLLVLLFGWRVDVNKFSLHNMYKNRLIRCYLGASNQSVRNEQPFTGLDDADDLPLSTLGGAVDKFEPMTTTVPAQRPMQIINATLNLTQGNNLAWQERKAASFSFTPVLCGFSLERTQGDSTAMDNRASGEIPGYRLTVDYGVRKHEDPDDEEKGFTLGMALATSGAALSPNMGHASRPVRAFVLTLFNVRLGRWSANPAGDKWHKPSPAFGLVPLLQELFGYSNERSNFVYLSDGGHFDNLGIYELVRRRCGTIFAVDAGADPERKMDDLAETIRKCRIDLGVEIEMPELPWLQANENGLAQQGYARGVIRYDLDDRDQDGMLILLKPTLTRARTEPVDVLNYARLNPPFPQQTTADQFFDESQFESYRRLGLGIAEECLTQYGGRLLNLTDGLPAAPPEQLGEGPAWSTRFVGFLATLLGRPRKPFPPRDGVLADMHVGFLFMMSAGFILFYVFDAYVLGMSSHGCHTLAGCQASLQELVAASRASPKWFLARAFADDVFVLIYSATLISGYLVALAHARRTRLWLGLLFLLVLLGAGADLTENAVQMSWTQETTPSALSPDLAPVTLAKFVLVSVALVILFVMELWIVPVLRRRWR